MAKKQLKPAEAVAEARDLLRDIADCLTRGRLERNSVNLALGQTYRVLAMDAADKLGKVIPLLPVDRN